LYTPIRKRPAQYRCRNLYAVWLGFCWGCCGVQSAGSRPR